jgi:hypothetical protein
MPRRAKNVPFRVSLPYRSTRNNCEACFFEPENYPYYLELWKENAKRCEKKRDTHKLCPVNRAITTEVRETYNS